MHDGKLIELLTFYSANPDIAKVITETDNFYQDDACYLPERYWDKRVPNSIVKVLFHGVADLNPYWFITLAVRYDKDHKELIVKAIEDVEEEDEGYHLQRVCLFKKFSFASRLCILTNNKFVTSFEETTIPSGKKLKLYTHDHLFDFMWLRCKKDEEQEYYTDSIFNIAYLPELVDSAIQAQDKQSPSGDLTVSSLTAGGAYGSQENRFAVDMSMMAMLFKQVFGRRKPLHLRPIFTSGLRIGDQKVYVVISKLPILQEILYEFMGKIIGNLSGSIDVISSILTFKDVFLLTRVRKLDLHLDMAPRPVLSESLTAKRSVTQREARYRFSDNKQDGILADQIQLRGDPARKHKHP